MLHVNVLVTARYANLLILLYEIIRIVDEKRGTEKTKTKAVWSSRSLKKPGVP